MLLYKNNVSNSDRTEFQIKVNELAVINRTKKITLLESLTEY